MNLFRQKSKLTRGKGKSQYHSTILNDPVPKMFSSELKAVSTYTNTGVTNAGVWTKINFPLQGTQSDERVADRVRAVTLEHIGSFTTSLADTLRIIVLQTKGYFTTVPTTSEVLLGASAGSPIVYNARELYEILADNYISMSPTGDSTVVTFRRYIKVKMPELKFKAGSADVYSGQIYVLAICLSGAGTMAQGNDYRLWYEDGN